MTSATLKSILDRFVVSSKQMQIGLRNIYLRNKNITKELVIGKNRITIMKY